ncbi:class I SAM-dependent methyltransferase [Candidatus Nomurabacteria bacterium]|nr:class I SAM-dependent methyltransferase [Candidatus Nomurabacteria bacterium]
MGEFLESKYILVGIVLGVFFLLYYLLLYIRTRVPMVITPKQYVQTFKNEFGSKLLDQNTIFAELGSGWGHMAFAAEHIGVKEVYAYELSPVHIYASKLKAYAIKSKVRFLRKDFLEEDLSKMDVCYVFLVPVVVEQLWKKMQEECKSGTVMILLGHKIDAVEPSEILPLRCKGKIQSYFYIYRVK